MTAHAQTSRPRRKLALSADTRALVALAERIRRKIVHFSALPSRDPKTGAFTGPGGAVTADALRTAWRIPARPRSRPLARIAPRPRAGK